MSAPADAAAFLPALPEPAREPALGAADAAVRVLQYGDCTCPGCRRARDIIRRTRERLGDVVFVYRQLPSARRAPDSETAARAALAASLGMALLAWAGSSRTSTPA